MNIKLNGEILFLENNILISDFITAKFNEKEPKGIAVALNNMIIPKCRWGETLLNENDNVEIVHAVQGG
ncbi:MAG: sulfur carrier protein ThiS [Ignavibacteria bacterium]|nr:sulfur carrier protein ThiS [Ignavibacteria bacterium]